MSQLWDESFSVGVAAMDRQHQRILELIAELRDFDETKPEAPDMPEILFRLTCYVQEHFEQEEALLIRHGYPGLADQADEHKAFAREVAAYCMRMFDQKEPPRSGLLPFLEHWWSHHILDLDMAYKPFFQAKGVR